MRRAIPVAAAVAVGAVVLVLLLGAGGGGREQATTRLDDVLGYFAKDAPLVAVAPTDLASPQLHALAAVLGPVQVVDPLVDRLAGRLGLRDVDFNRDLKPELGGAPLVAGIQGGAYRRAGLKKAIVVATRIRNTIKIKRLLLRQPDLLPRTKPHGVRIWENRFGGSFAAALDGHILVAGGSRQAVAEALDNRRSIGRMRQSDFDDALAGLPRAAALRVSAYPRALLAGDKRLRGALRVPWVAALRRAGAALTATPAAIALAFRLHTDSSSVSTADLPLAPHAGAVPLIGGPGEVAIGVREPARVLQFAAALGRALAPKRAARLAAAEHALGEPGREIESDFTELLGPTASVAIDPLTRAWAARFPLPHSAAMNTALQQVADSLPDLAAALGFRGLGVATPDVGEPFYALARAHGPTVVFGVVGSALIAASSPHRAAALVTEATHTARGALVATVDAQRLALRLIGPRLGGLAALGAPLVLSSLGNVTLSASIDRSALSGQATLPLK